MHASALPKPAVAGTTSPLLCMPFSTTFLVRVCVCTWWWGGWSESLCSSSESLTRTHAYLMRVPLCVILYVACVCLYMCLYVCV